MIVELRNQFANALDQMCIGEEDYNRFLIKEDVVRIGMVIAGLGLLVLCSTNPAYLIFMNTHWVIYTDVLFALLTLTFGYVLSAHDEVMASVYNTSHQKKYLLSIPSLCGDSVQYEIAQNDVIQEKMGSKQICDGSECGGSVHQEKAQNSAVDVDGSSENQDMELLAGRLRTKPFTQWLGHNYSIEFNDSVCAKADEPTLFESQIDCSNISAADLFFLKGLSKHNKRLECFQGRKFTSTYLKSLDLDDGFERGLGCDHIVSKEEFEPYCRHFIERGAMYNNIQDYVLSIWLSFCEMPLVSSLLELQDVLRNLCILHVDAPVSVLKKKRKVSWLFDQQASSSHSTAIHPNEHTPLPSLPLSPISSCSISPNVSPRTSPCRISLTKKSSQELVFPDEYFDVFAPLDKLNLDQIKQIWRDRRFQDYKRVLTADAKNLEVSADLELSTDSEVTADLNQSFFNLGSHRIKNPKDLSDEVWRGILKDPRFNRMNCRSVYHESSMATLY